MKKKSILLTRDDIKHYAQLANLPLQDNQISLFRDQLSETLSYVQQLEGVSTKGIDPTAQVTGLTNVFREDIVVPGLSKEDALRNAPFTYKGFFKVKSVFKE